MIRSFSGIIVELNDVTHEKCIKCKNIMLYNKDNSVCLNCDNGISQKLKEIIST